MRTGCVRVIPHIFISECHPSFRYPLATLWLTSDIPVKEPIRKRVSAPEVNYTHSRAMSAMEPPFGSAGDYEITVALSFYGDDITQRFLGETPY